jgi:hypothetical protein
VKVFWRQKGASRFKTQNIRYDRFSLPPPSQAQSILKL